MINVNDIDADTIEGRRIGIVGNEEIFNGRTHIIEQGRAPRWLFIDSSGMRDIYGDSHLVQHLITLESVLRNPLIRNVSEAVADFNEIKHEEAHGILMGMQIIETSEIPSYSIIITADKDGRPDQSCAVEVKY